MTSSSCSAFENELHRFLSTERGFRPEQWGDEYENIAVIHYVAGREFETAEEFKRTNGSATWFWKERKTLTSLLGSLDLCIKFQRTPLHCACKWGNLYGVNWLLNRSATVNVEDNFGWTPYLCASTSSIDALKKMKVLEDHDCDVPSLAIRWAISNQFSSFTEAHEVLRYLVFEKGLSIDSQYGELPEMSAPLYDSFRGGNIFGVKWLIDNGANIDVVIQQCGKDLYEDVSKSSVDTLKKLRILEDHGCEVSPRAIVLAPGVRFASSKEACDLFHHLVKEREMSVHFPDEESNSPLHCACEHRSLPEVKWLVENGAAIDSVNKEGITPLMMACESGIDRLLKVRYLTNKGADCQVKDMLGRTALFYAVRYTIADNFDDPPYVPSERSLANECSISECELKDVLQYLVEDRRMEIDSSDEDGMTPLLHACFSVCYPLFALRPLVELKADVAAKDSMGRNALHLVALSDERDFQSVIKFLIDKGADVTCEDKDGKKPYQLAENGEISMFLVQRYNVVRFSFFIHATASRDSIKLCMIGSEMAGKTTFVNALLQLDIPPISQQDRTAGIFIPNGPIPGVGKGVIWDFGAQSTFHGAHSLFFRRSNTMFVLVLRFRDGDIFTPEQRLLEIGRYWCAFVKAALPMLPSHLRSPLNLIIVGNVVNCGEVDGVEAHFELKRVAKNLQEDFREYFNVLHVLEMDCSKSDSVRMNDGREKLKAVRQTMLHAVPKSRPLRQEAGDVPKLLPAIEKKLSLSDKKLGCFVSSENFCEWLAREVDVKSTEYERKKSVQYLDSSGIIVNLGGRICLRPLWLCSNVIGPLLAPRYFPFGMKTAKPGIVAKKDIESALSAFEDYLKYHGTSSHFSVKADEAIKILLSLELCIEVKHAPGMYQLPALLQDSIPGDAWVENPEFDVYRGQRYECADPIDIILPLSFSIFQSRSSRMAEIHVTWKDGVKLVKIIGEKVVECLVTLGMKKGHCCIDVVLRWSNQTACHELAKKMLDELKATVVSVCEERSPGVLLNWFYLDSTHLKRFDNDPAVYLSRNVNQKVKDRSFNDKLVSHRPEGCHSAVKDLAIVDVFQERKRVVSHTMKRFRYRSGKKRGGSSKRELSRAKRLPASHSERSVDEPEEMASQVVAKSSAAPCKGGSSHLRGLDIRGGVIVRKNNSEATIASADRIQSPCASDSFPNDDESVPDALMRACAAVNPSKWEHLGIHLGIATSNLDEFRVSPGSNFTRMFRVLESWKKATESPKVRQLLSKFKRIGVSREAIRKEFKEMSDD